MRPFAIVGVLLLSACSADRLVQPDRSRATTMSASDIGGIKEPPCLLPAPLVFYVQAGHTKGNGSFRAPFGTIGAALAAGAARSACHLRVLLRGGTFAESFAVPVPRLEISVVGGRNTITGAIVNAGHWLEVRGIAINATDGVGLRQVGGRLQLAGVSITGALADEKHVDSGIGLWLSGGALATLDLVVIDGSAHQAIRLEDLGTEAWLTGVIVSNTGIHPLILERFLDGILTEDDHRGAVQVSHGAKAIITFSSITGSTIFALEVDHGAQALLRRSRVSGTGEGPVGGRPSTSFNIESRFGAVVETFFVLTRDARVDIGVENNAFFTSHHGVVGGADIGLVLHNLTAGTGYSPQACASLDNTIFTDVLVPLQTDVVLPPPGDPFGPPPDYSAACRHVANDPRPF